MHSEPTKRNFAYCVTMLLTAALAGALCAIGPRGGYAGELEDLQAEFGALDPEVLLAECRAQESRARKALPQLEDIRRKSSELHHKRESLLRTQLELDSRSRILRGRVFNLTDRRDERVEQCRADAQRGEKECLDLRARLDEAMQPDIEELRSLEERSDDLQDERDTLLWRVQDLDQKGMVVKKETGIDHAYELSPQLSRLAARCDRLERLAKLKRALLESPQAAEPPAERKDVDKLAQEADAAVVSGDIEKAKKLAKELADETGADDPRTKKVIDDLGRETEARQVVAEAKRRYDEATLLDIVDEPAQSAEAYRVAMSLLQEAREKTSSPERREKIDQAIARVVQRIADLPEAGTPQAGANGLMAAQRAAGNRECSEKYRDSIFVKADPVTGGHFCGCRSGSTWNSDRTACVKAPRTLVRASCSKSFPGSVPAGFKNGLPQCGCPSGRVWNSSRTACVPGAQTAQGLDPRVAYELGALLGQVLRSRSRQPPAGCHYRPGTRELHCGGG